MSRRVIFLLALLIVAGGAIAALVISQQPIQQPDNTPLPGETRIAQNPSGTPQATNTPVPTALPTIDIVVAVQPIVRGQRIQPNDVVLRTWPEPYAPLSAILDTELVIGKIARTDIEREMPILTSHLTDDFAKIAPIGSDAAAILPPGTRMVAVPIDRLTSVAYALQPGDRVDMIVSMLYVDIDEDFQTRLPNNLRIISVEDISEEGSLSLTIESPVDGRTDSLPIALGALGVVNLPIIIQPSEDPRPRLATQMTIQDALVMYVGDFPRNGRIFTRASSAAAPPAETAEPTAPAANKADATPTPLPPRPDIISLAVSPQDAVVLAYFIEAKVPVTFALRPASETGIASILQVDIDYIMDIYNIKLPRKLPYAIEPAIRSIRQLVASESISLLPTAAAVAPR